MSKNRLYFEGLDLREWETLSGEMFDEAEAIVRDYVLGAEQEIRDAYPETAAGLRTGMTHAIAPNRDAMIIVASVSNKHPLAWLFDNGSKARHTKKGWSRGAERPRHIFVPRAYDWNRREIAELQDMLIRGFGFTVSGQNDEGDLIA